MQLLRYSHVPNQASSINGSNSKKSLNRVCGEQFGGETHSFSCKMLRNYSNINFENNFIKNL